MKIDNQRFKALFLKLDISQKEMAEELNISQGQLSSILSGRTIEISKSIINKVNEIALKDPRWDFNLIEEYYFKEAEPGEKKENALIEEYRTMIDFLKGQLTSQTNQLEKAHDTINNQSSTINKLVKSKGNKVPQFKVVYPNWKASA